MHDSPGVDYRSESILESKQVLITRFPLRMGLGPYTPYVVLILIGHNHFNISMLKYNNNLNNSFFLN